MGEKLWNPAYKRTWIGGKPHGTSLSVSRSQLAEYPVHLSIQGIWFFHHSRAIDKKLILFRNLHIHECSDFPHTQTFLGHPHFFNPWHAIWITIVTIREIIIAIIIIWIYAGPVNTVIIRTAYTSTWTARGEKPRLIFRWIIIRIVSTATATLLGWFASGTAFSWRGPCTRCWMSPGTSGRTPEFFWLFRSLSDRVRVSQLNKVVDAKPKAILKQSSDRIDISTVEEKTLRIWQ